MIDIDLLKEIEIELRSQSMLSRATWEKLSDLTDWELRIVQDFILRVELAKQHNDLNFVYRRYDIEQPRRRDVPSKDLLIVTLKRNEKDTALTDATNRLVVPTHLKFDTLVIWGMSVTAGRNFAIEHALTHNFDHVLFIDDDIIAPNTALVHLWDLMYNTDLPPEVLKYTNGSRPLVVASNYYRKCEPLISAHVYEQVSETLGVCTSVCAMGFTLINVKEIARSVPLPLFWEFGAPDGYWTMGEDAFFTRNLIERLHTHPIVDLSTECLHYDKQWKRVFGRRDPDVTYATGMILDFETIRVPPAYPLILVGIPTRTSTSPIAVDLTKMELLRGYRTDVVRVSGYPVDEARNILARKALEMGAEYLLFIDDDVIPPVEGLNNLIRLIEQDKSIGMVVGEYTTKGADFWSAHLVLHPETGVVTEVDRVYTSGVVECNWLTGLGFALIRTEVFRQLTYPWFKCITHRGDKELNEDAWFCEKLLHNGYRILIDIDTPCLHVNWSTGEVFCPRNMDAISGVWATNMLIPPEKYKKRRA